MENGAVKSGTILKLVKCAEPLKTLGEIGFFVSRENGGEEGIRTLDLHVAKVVRELLKAQ